MKGAALLHPRAAEALDKLAEVFRDATWPNPVAMKQAISDIDPVKVKSGKTVYVCHIRRNEYRLIISVHFDRQRLYTLRFFTHAEYDRRNWKDEL
jgi:mRNA interferase HigB